MTTITEYRNKSIVLILSLIFTCLTTSGQTDSLKNFRFEIPREIYDYELEHIDFLNNFSKLSTLSSIANDPSSLWIRTRLQLNALSEFSPRNDSKPDILNPLYQKYLANQNMRVIKSILGSVSLGATAYLAYRHIKKYGFLKKK
jgi:hypothetical protein